MKTALIVSDDLAQFETSIDGSLSELRKLSQRGVELIVSLGRPFYEILRRRLYKQRCDDWREYCLNRFGVTGDRCRQIADAYEVGRTLSASAGIDGTKDPTMMLEYLGSIGFSDLIARSLKHVPAEQQPAVFDQARQIADGASVTPKMVDTAASEATTTPLEWQQMTKEEQLKTVTEAEDRAGEVWDRQRCVEWVLLVAKRIRAPLAASAGLPLSADEKAVAEKLAELVAACEEALAPPKARAA